MKYILPLLLAVTFSSCSTIKDARQDFTNFRRTIAFNLKQEAVYGNATFTPTHQPSNLWHTNRKTSSISFDRPCVCMASLKSGTTFMKEESVLWNVTGTKRMNGTWSWRGSLVRLFTTWTSITKSSSPNLLMVLGILVLEDLLSSFQSRLDLSRSCPENSICNEYYELRKSNRHQPRS